MAISRSDFKASRKHSGYYTRDLGDNGTGDGSKWVEVVRKDGYGLGAVPVPYLDQSIEAFERQKVPMGKTSIDDIFEAPAPLEPPEGVEAEPAKPAPDAEPSVEIREGRAAKRS